MVLRVNKALRSALRELAITAKDFIVKQIPSFPFPLLSPISTSMPVTRDIGSVAGWSVQYLINDIDMFQPLWSSATIGQPRIYVSTNTFILEYHRGAGQSPLFANIAESGEWLKRRKLGWSCTAPQKRYFDYSVPTTCSQLSRNFIWLLDYLNAHNLSYHTLRPNHPSICPTVLLKSD